MIYALFIAGMIACSMQETSYCGTNDIEPINLKQMMDNDHVLYHGVQYDKVSYYIAVEKDEKPLMMKPSWSTQNYDVYPTHSYPYDSDANVYFSKTVNQFRVMNEEGVLEMQEYQPK